MRNLILIKELSRKSAMSWLMAYTRPDFVAALLALTPLLAPLLTGCQTATAPYTASSGEPTVSTGTAWATPAEPEPPAFVEAACGGCHAVEPPFLSPNPEAPSFEAIANRRGLSEATLGTWLKEAHNYPEQMDFDLEEAQADQIAAYMVRLRRDDYQPEP